MLKFLKGNFSFTLAFIVLLLDFASKFFTHHFLPLRTFNSLWYPYGGLGVFKNFYGIEFSIVHATNKGAAWGMLADYQDELLIFRVLLILGLVIYSLLINKNKSWQIPLLLIIAGATGNVIDFFLYGHVVDMLHFVFWGYDFPVFNIADSAIFVGISTLFVLSSTESSTKAAKKPAKG